MRPSIFFALLLVSTLVPAKEINPKRLDVIEGGAIYELTEPFVYQTNFYRSIASYTLVPGNYVEGFRARDGIYLVGGVDSVQIRLETPGEAESAASITYTEGGVFLPNDTNASPRMYFVRHSAPRIEYLRNGVVHSTRNAQATASSVSPNSQIAETAVPGASPVVAGIGTGIAYGLVNAMIRAGEGKFLFPKKHDGDRRISELMVRVEGSAGTSQIDVPN
ncbi:MAG: hypothetical protein ACT4NL_04900 [Pseudomarimonas sp.]